MSDPTPIDLPVGLRWVKLVCRLGRLVTDSVADADAHPDLLPVGGTLTLTASPSRVRMQEADGRWRSVEVAGRTYTIRADGELVDNEGRVGVYIPDPASLLVEPQGYAITAEVKPTGGTDWRVIVGGDAVLPDVVDLVAVSSVGSASPSVTASFDARIYSLEQGDGVPQAVEDYLTANPPASAPDATTATKGILQLAGDLGGTADAPAVPGLADKADTGHGHAIGDVTGLQSALDGKQAAGSYAAASHDHDGTYAPALGADDNYVTDAEKAALHTHPAVIAEGATAAAARTAIGAGTSNLALGTTASTAKAGNYAPPAATATVQGVVELATTAETTTGTDTTRAVTPAGVKAVADTKANASHSHTAAQVSGLATVATSGAYADLTGTPTIPDSHDDIGAAPATHDHTAADIDSGAATDGHVLTADGAGGAAWEPTASGGGGSIAGLNVITGSWPPPLQSWQYPAGTLYVRDPEESFGPVMAVRGSDWKALAVDGILSMGEIEPEKFIPGIATMAAAQWSFGAGGSEALMGLAVNSTPEPGDTLCTINLGTLDSVQQECLEDAGRAGVLTGTGLGESGPESSPSGIHYLAINTEEGFIRYLDSAGEPPAPGGFIVITWPVNIRSTYWEPYVGP